MKSLAALVFPGFQTLDFFGPIEILGDPANGFAISTVAKATEPVVSRHGQRISVDRVLADGTAYDLLFLPGGDSALEAAKDPELMDWIRQTAENAQLVMAVCTGSVLLGMTGVLDGRKATTNKVDFTATVPLAPNVDWVKEARWVEDGKFFTSSGVSAGMDMALGAVRHLFGAAQAEETAQGIEYLWNSDPSNDPFAQLEGLI